MLRRYHKVKVFAGALVLGGLLLFLVPLWCMPRCVSDTYSRSKGNTSNAADARISSAEGQYTARKAGGAGRNPEGGDWESFKPYLLLPSALGHIDIISVSEVHLSDGSRLRLSVCRSDVLNPPSFIYLEKKEQGKNSVVAGIFDAHFLRVTTRDRDKAEPFRKLSAVGLAGEARSMLHDCSLIVGGFYDPDYSLEVMHLIGGHLGGNAQVSLLPLCNEWAKLDFTRDSSYWSRHSVSSQTVATKNY
jgi:hypothetical protein